MKHKHHVDRRISALAPLPDASHYGRHRSWDIEGRELKHCAARPRGLPVRDTRAPRTAIGARHHPAHRIVRSSHARHAHEGGTLRRDRQIPRRLFLRLDTLGARRARGLHLDPLGARAVGSATEAAPVVQGNGRWRFLPICRERLVVEWLLTFGYLCLDFLLIATRLIACKDATRGTLPVSCGCPTGGTTWYCMRPRGSTRSMRMLVPCD